MTVDYTISVGNLFSAFMAVIAFVYALGILKQKFMGFDDFMVEVRGQLTLISKQMIELAVQHERMERLEEELMRLRDWRHDTETILRGIQAKQQGII